MPKQFIKKEGLALSQLALYLLGEQVGHRLKTIDELSIVFSLSVGVIQQALKQLESRNHVQLARRGCHGTRIEYLDISGLLSQAQVHNIVCAMPLPYSKLYEGLASGLKAQIEQIPLYFAHMRGADARIECLLDSVYDLAVVSRLAAQHYLEQNQVEIVLTLGLHSYVNGHQLICRKNQNNEAINKVGLDFSSPDQRLLTKLYFDKQEIELINIPYNKGLAMIEKRHIDAMIWNTGDNVVSKKLVKLLLNDNPLYQQATEAVILVQQGNNHIKQFIKSVVDINLLLQHQQQVVAGEIDPSY